ncbi:4Fe-4S dicluster domain-containing protein [Affinibrenneria salicis]|uniref:4Fe-4S dicluster domain-containing protein n=1 Tax=Affinibrenneria salicis TaxID=2590031 RepID=A0A5J5FXS8_9GAMM|nr:4Fe-4S dicluster domain-containing protein [Affinibrenneria salicis]KAA8998414.1 4Fe-4S dicluster domain-containing protein [Affinibrenneria salicis]
MNQFVIADASLCIGCRTCEMACAVAHAGGGSAAMRPEHFFPRLSMVKNAQISVPVMCRQCENAPCASTCPNEALVRHHDSIQPIQSRCIGCKSCVVVCPFGAINVVMRADQQPARSEVHKCDLCVGVADSPSCVAVCPTSALKWVKAADLQQTIRDRQALSARESADMARC